jgi:hypothetical protein
MFPDRYGVAKAREMGARTLNRVLDRFVALIAEEVPAAKHRQKIMRRFEELVQDLRDWPEEEDGEE